MKTLTALDREELIKRFVSVEFNRFLEYYRNAPDLNVSEYKKSRETKNDFKDKRSDRPSTTGKVTRLILNVGKKDGANPSRLIGEINDFTGNRGIRVGKIEIMNSSSILEVESRFVPQIKGVFQDLMINGKPVVIEEAKDKKPRNDGERGFRGSKPLKSADKTRWRK
jgi:ATP-dependent RNA helicase DeaD